MTPEQWANTYLGGYVKMELQKRREAVREMSQEGMSLRQIGDVLGVNHQTVSNDLHSVENSTNTNGQKPDSVETSTETENVEAWKAKHEAQLHEQHERETYYRLTEEAYSTTLALSVKESVQHIYDRLEDKDFRHTLAKRIRYDAAEIPNII
jgi:predicted transcriptional regulator